MNYLIITIIFLIASLIGFLGGYIEDKRYNFTKQCIPSFLFLSLLSILAISLNYNRTNIVSETYILAASFGLLLSSSIIDFKTYELPDSLTVIFGIILAVFGVVHYIPTIEIPTRILTVIIYILFIFYLNKKMPNQIGLGDLKLTIPILFVLGFVQFLYFILFACIFSILFGMIKVKVLNYKGVDANIRNTPVPFGPFMYLSLLLILTTTFIG